MEDLDHQEDLGNSNLVTPSEAMKRGITIRKAPPGDVTCRYCGKKLSPRGLVMGNEVVLWVPAAPRCDCKGAEIYWREYDRRQREEKEKRSEEERKAEMQKRIDRLLAGSGIKKRFQERTFDNFRRDTPGRAHSYDIAKEYADNFAYHKARGDGLYIEGTNGTGKTHLAAAIALQLIGQGIPVICKTSSDLLMDIKRAFDNPELKEHQIIDVYRKADLLIVDDLGKERCSDWSMSTLYTIFNDRYEEMKPIIITTNYNTDDLRAALTPEGHDDTKIAAIISRLREVSTVITMAWKDIRGE